MRDELLNRVGFTLGALLVFRLGTFVPVPGVDPAEFGKFLMSSPPGLLGDADVLVGGAFSRMSLFALGLTTYFAALVIIRLWAALSPPVDAQGRRASAQRTYLLTAALAAASAFGIAIALEASGIAVVEPGWAFRITTVAALTGGAMFLLWLGEQITRRGVGHGPSLIVAAGIVAGLPNAAAGLSQLHRVGAIALGGVLVLLAMILVMVGVVVSFERARRRVLTVVPRRSGGGQASELQLRLNGAGMLPPVLAVSALSICGVVMLNFGYDESGNPEQRYRIAGFLDPGYGLGLLLQAALIVLFALLFRHATHDPHEEVRKLADAGGFIPGIRPGEKTARDLGQAQNRLSMIGAAYLAIVYAVPVLLFAYLASPMFALNAGLVVVTIVVIDLVERLQRDLRSS